MIPGPDLVIACPRCGALQRVASLRSGNTFGAEVWSDGWHWAPMLPLPPVISRCHGCGRFYWCRRAERVGELESPIEECPVFDVSLADRGPRRVEVMQLLRHKMGLSFQEVKARLDQLPLYIGQFNKAGAQELTAAFQALGARVLAQAVPDEPKALPTIPREWREAPSARSPDEAGWLEAIAQGLATDPGQEQKLRLEAWWAGNEPYRRGVPWKPFSQRSQAANDNLLALLAQCSLEDPVQRLFRAEALRELERFDEALDILAGAFPEQMKWVAESLRTLAQQRISEVRKVERTEATAKA